MVEEEEADLEKKEVEGIIKEIIIILIVIIITIIKSSNKLEEIKNIDKIITREGEIIIENKEDSSIRIIIKGTKIRDLMIKDMIKNMYRMKKIINKRDKDKAKTTIGK
jgi:hypothetical protein